MGNNTTMLGSETSNHKKDPNGFGSASILLALAAIFVWGFLAVISSKLIRLPALLVTGIALSLGGMIGLVRVREWKIPMVTFLVGVSGIFGYHFLLFTAFRHAPMVEANLINYLWPLLIVVLSPMVLKGYRLGVHHVVGALAGLTGAGLLVSGGRLNFDVAALSGYLAAFSAAVIWALYSLLTKRLPLFPSGAVGVFCLSAGVLSLSIYLFEAGPAGFLILQVSDWLFLCLLGIGPLGAAFFLWDASMKRGDPRKIGSLSYLTPLLSTLFLVILGGKRLTVLSLTAMVFILAGALVGSFSFKKSERKRSVERN
jgi:drug/metabolite transporter (DMT)-like permease